MRREALNYVLDWLKEKERKPLILRGARQVGKTWLAREAARVSGRKLIEFNFEKQPALANLFTSHDPRAILLNLESHFNHSIDPEKTVLFLDEIQAYPPLLAKLRWFYEELPILPVICAGSLLEFVLADHEFSMPVGRITYLHLGPLSFEEFLQASDQEKLYELITRISYPDETPLVIHEKLLELFKEYLLVGGMPAAVVSWIENRSFTRTNRIQHDLLATYRDDFAKYAGRIARERLDEVLVNTPRMLGEKFVYSRVNKGVQIASIKQALTLLIQAKLISPVHCTSANGLPLMSEIRERERKMIFIDVGLANALLDLRLTSLADKTLANQGGISEQVVGQLLRTLTPYYVEPHLFYWSREEKGSSAEVDYIIAHEGDIIPIEVKSGSTGGLKSLHSYMALKKKNLAVRINSEPLTFTPVQVKIHSGESVEYRLLSIPFYLTGQLHRLLKN